VSRVVPLVVIRGLNDIKRLAELNEFAAPNAQRGIVTSISIDDAYTQALLVISMSAALTPLKIVVNAGNGMAGHVIDNLER